MRETKYKVYLKCVGLKKRERKVKRHSFDELGYVELNHDIEDLKVKAKDWLEKNMRSYVSARLDLEKVEHDLSDRGYFIEHWSPFGEGHIRGVEVC